jgi:hypothetical protein
LTELDDVSEQLDIKYTNTHYDRATNSMSVDAQIENTSEETILGPVKLRVLSLKSDIGIPEVLGADNGEAASGAVWDFTTLLQDNRLKPKEKSKVKRLEFKVSDLRPLRPPDDYMMGLVRIQAKALGKLEKKAPSR